MKIATLGAGAMGQVAIRDLCESSCVTEVLIADLSLDRADMLKSRLYSDKIKTARVDVCDAAGLSAALSGYDVVINCTPYCFNVLVMEAALSAGCHYLDLGGLFHVTRKQLERHQQFLSRNLLCIPGMGAAPGLTNIMAAAAVSEMDTVESIDIVAASIDRTVSRHPFLPPYALDTILDEYSLNPFVFVDGEFKEVPAMSGEQVQEFPEPVGKSSTFLTLHSEIATLPISYREKGIKQVTYRLGLPVCFHERCRFLVDLGFASRNALRVDSAEVLPRRFLAALIENQQVQVSDPDDCEVIRVDVSGVNGNHPVKTRMELTVMSDRNWNVSAGALDTGVPPSIAAQMILEGEIKARGVCPPELCVPAESFFAHLARRGMMLRQLKDHICMSD